MTYDELNQTNPYNYFPTGDSAKFGLPEDKVSRFRRLWKKHHPKKKQDDFTANEPVSMPPTETDKMIVVGGLVGESATCKYQHLAQIAFQIWNKSHLAEKKNSKKRKSRNSSVTGMDPRSVKLRKLKNDDDHWVGLE